MVSIKGSPHSGRARHRSREGVETVRGFFFNLDAVLLLYVFNFSMVLIEICLWFKYRERRLSFGAAASRRSEAYGAADTLLGA